jgi:hypothetical protein
MKLLEPYFRDLGGDEKKDGVDEDVNQTIQYYDGDASKAEREHFNMIDIAWGGGKCYVLIYTPIVGAGIYFNLDHFDAMFTVAVGCSGTAAAFAQQLDVCASCRTVRSKDIIYI